MFFSKKTQNNIATKAIICYQNNHSSYGLSGNFVGASGMQAIFLFNKGNLGYNKIDFVFIYIERIINK